MPFNPLDLIKYVPPSARRILEISNKDSGLAAIFRERAPLSTVIRAEPDDILEDKSFDCLVLFDDGIASEELAALLAGLSPRGQILAAPDATGPDLEQALAEAGCHIFDREPFLRAWNAPEAPPSIALHCSITPELVADADIRIHRPNSFLRCIPGFRPFSQVESFSASLSAGAETRILLMHRAIPRRERDIPFLKAALAAGYLIILDLDDDPHHFAGHYADDAFALRCLHAAQVSTPTVAERLREHVDEIAVFANHLPALPHAVTRPKTPVRIFIGGYNRGNDWPAVAEAANRTLLHSDALIEVEVVHERSIFDALAVSSKRFTPRLPYQEYLKLLASCHIALLPLNDTAFNRCKSDLKFIESAAHGVAVLAPPTVYGASVSDGRTGVLYRSPREFMVGLHRLIREADLRDKLVRAGRSHVANSRMLADHYEARHAWYLDLLSRAESLRAAHRSRAPELYE